MVIDGDDITLANDPNRQTTERRMKSRKLADEAGPDVGPETEMGAFPQRDTAFKRPME